MRIVGGSYGGRRLRAPASNSTRPTTDRVREALFNCLGQRVDGLRVLDCYAGSGALGIEALSRGATFAVFVEKNRAAASIVEDNLSTLGIDCSQAKVIVRAIEQSANILATSGPFDLWLVDPPFAMVRDGSCARALALLMKAGLLSSDGRVVMEYPSDTPCPVVPGLQPLDIRRYGDSCLVFMAPGQL